MMRKGVQHDNSCSGAAMKSPYLRFKKLTLVVKDCRKLLKEMLADDPAAPQTLPQAAPVPRPVILPAVLLYRPDTVYKSLLLPGRCEARFCKS
ncbi:hypothetical protein TKK_0014041 [Trichogramma kaykai]